MCSLIWIALIGKQNVAAAEAVNIFASEIKSAEKADKVLEKDDELRQGSYLSVKNGGGVRKVTQKTDAEKREVTATDSNKNGFSCKLCVYLGIRKRDFQAHMASKHGMKEARDYEVR